MALTRPATLLYLFLVLMIVVFIQIGIRTGQRPDMVMEADTEGGFKPMAQKIEETKTRMKEAESEVIRAASTGPENLESEMALIPAGEFVMGNNDGPLDQQPARSVFLDAFQIDRYEVTFAKFYAFVLATDHRKPRLAGYLAVDSSKMHLLLQPANAAAGVSWFDAEAYCEYLGKRLPTEAEWEKAARGTDERLWPWGNEEFAPLANLAGVSDGFPFLAPVDAFHQDRSPYGIYGMAGNVMEWTADWYQEDYYTVAPSRNPKGPGREGFRAGPERVGFRVIRGASWNDSIKRAGTATRFRAHPEYRDVTIGFRCVKEVSG
jgi:formylglycine-generating enzyme